MPPAHTARDGRHSREPLFRRARCLAIPACANCSRRPHSVPALPFNLFASISSSAATQCVRRFANQTRTVSTLGGARITWLPFLDTYRTMCLAPPPEFRRVLEEGRTLTLAD